MDEPAPLANPIAFWDARHADLGPWRSGGDRGLSNEENYEFYAYRLGRIVEMIRRHMGAERRQRILEVGCGRGYFVHSLRQCGHRAYGVDPSPTAIAWARDTYGPDPFEVGTGDHYQTAEPFQVVLCIDVLFHILDDDEWRAALARLTRLAAAESVIIVTDVMGSSCYPISNYIRHRSRAMYDEAMGSLGFQCVESMPYDFGANPNQFAVFERRC